jgi:hypothetical protein
MKCNKLMANNTNCNINGDNINGVKKGGVVWDQVVVATTHKNPNIQGNTIGVGINAIVEHELINQNPKPLCMCLFI